MKITDRDRCRLGDLLTCETNAALGNAYSRSELEMLMEDATAIGAEGAPPELVTMNSTVVLVDLNSGQRAECTLVYPEDRDLIANSVGVLQPLGRRILGRSAGEIVEVRESGHAKRFLIESVLYQPEAAGDTHL
jgi:regulator of nucleoside diphosphate kinase